MEINNCAFCIVVFGSTRISSMPLHKRVWSKPDRINDDENVEDAIAASNLSPLAKTVKKSGDWVIQLGADDVDEN